MEPIRACGDPERNPIKTLRIHGRFTLMIGMTQSFRKTFSDENKLKLREELGLTYHVNYLAQAQDLVGLHGERVLEVGGSMPEKVVLDSLEAEYWVGVEDYDYWTALPENGKAAAAINKLTTQSVEEMSGVESFDKLIPYSVLLGKIEELPTACHGQFSRIFSLACFEHIHRMQTALDAMYHALEPRGLVYSFFAPLWSTHNGHHLPDVEDENGNVWNFANNPLPPWGHLLMSPSQMQDFLERKMDRWAASEIVYNVFHNPHINRFFVEDYVDFFNRSPFTIKQIGAQPQNAPSENVKQQLIAAHPHRSNFETEGIVVVLEKGD
jgi:SAM-dependent methyltransferase